MARRKHRKRSRHDKPVSVHERPTLNPAALSSAPPVAMSIAPDPEDIFFAEPTPTDFVLDEEPSENAKRVSAMTMRASTSRFLPMVKIVVTACAVLIFAGGIRSAVARSHNNEGWAKKSVTTANERAATSAPMPENLAGSAIGHSSPEEAPPGIDAIASRDKTNASQAKLEHGAVKASIDLGEEAVKLDPTSARAWLVLGAAYQQRGDVKNAWRCYHACVDLGEEGKDRAECASML